MLSRLRPARPGCKPFESDGSVNNSTAVTTRAGEVSGSWDFAFTQTGTQTIDGNVYGDWNNNSDFDAGDEGFSGVNVDLYADVNGDGEIDPVTDALIATVATDADGNYSFDATTLPHGQGLANGGYIVDVREGDLPGAFGQTEDPDATVDGQGEVTLTGSGATDIDFGYLPEGTASIGDTVWFDANGDGVQTGVSETGVVSVTVELWADLDGGGVYTLVMTTTTDADGNYLFDDLPNGSYQVKVDAADPKLPKDTFGNDTVPSTPTTYTATVANGDVTELNGVACTDCNLDADFGFAALGAIGDTVFWDANNNGQQDLERERHRRG